MSDIRTAGLRLRQWRRGQRLNRTELARKTGVSKSTLKRTEDHIGTPRARVLAALAMAGCDITWLLTGKTIDELRAMG